MADKEGKVELIQNLAWNDRWVAGLRVGGVGIGSAVGGAIGSAVSISIGYPIGNTVGVCLRGRSDTSFLSPQRWGN